MSMLAYRLMRLIEAQAEPLAEALEAQISCSERCPSYTRVPPEELKSLVSGVYGHLGQWLISKTENDIEQRYFQIGLRRAEQGVPASDLLWCIALVKETLWKHLKKSEMLDTAQIFGELELMQMVDQFFNHAMYFAMRGHESYAERQLSGMKS